MKEKTRDIPVHDLVLPSMGNIPFNVKKLTPSTAVDRHIRLAEFPHRHLFYEILYVGDGEGIHYIDFVSHPIRPDSLFFISPGQVHFFECPNRISGYQIIFNSDFQALFPEGNVLMKEVAFFHRVRESSGLRLMENQAARIKALIQNMDDEYGAGERASISLLRSYLHLLIIEAARWYDEAPVNVGPTRESSLVCRFLQLVSENFPREQSVQSYAGSLGISEGHLSETIKALTGFSPGEIIRRHIVLEAKRMLGLTDLTVAEIGYQMNFEDPSYFGRFLRRETGMSPGHLRRHIREKYHLFRE